MDLPPIMVTTPGITERQFCAEPLGTEGELTPGPDDVNPFRSAEEREIVEAYREKERAHRAEAAERPQPGGLQLPFDTAFEDPTAGRDPYAFDDVEPRLETSYPLPGHHGPMF